MRAHLPAALPVRPAQLLTQALVQRCHARRAAPPRPHHQGQAARLLRLRGAHLPCRQPPANGVPAVLTDARCTQVYTEVRSKGAAWALFLDWAGA